MNPITVIPSIAIALLIFLANANGQDIASLDRSAVSSRTFHADINAPEFRQSLRETLGASTGRLFVAVPGVGSVALSTAADFGLYGSAESWILANVSGVPIPRVPPIPPSFDYESMINVTPVIQIDGHSLRMAFVEETTNAIAKPAVVEDVPSPPNNLKSTTNELNRGPARSFVTRHRGRVVLHTGVTYAGWKLRGAHRWKKQQRPVVISELPPPAPPKDP